VSEISEVEVVSPAADIPMASLAGRWDNITPNTVSRRLAFLGIRPERRGNNRFITIEQRDLGDQLHDHIKNKKLPMEDFAVPGGETRLVARQVTAPAAQVAGQVEQLTTAIAALLQAQQQQQAPPSPLARARALREAAEGGLVLSTTELATILGRSAEGLARLRHGQRIAGYRVARQPAGPTDVEAYWLLISPDGLRVPGDPRRMAPE